MTSTVNVLPYMKELRDTWRRQNFTFTKEQQEEYDILLAARRERVRYFYDNDLVCKVSKSAMDKLKEEDWYKWGQPDNWLSPIDFLGFLCFTK